MSLIKIDKPIEKSIIKLSVNKSLAQQFEKEVLIFKKNNPDNIYLNFDNFVIKLISELNKINLKDYKDPEQKEKK